MTAARWSAGVAVIGVAIVLASAFVPRSPLIFHARPLGNTWGSTTPRPVAEDPERRPASQHEEAFLTMINRCANYSEEQLRAVTDRKLRQLIAGAAAGARTPEIVRAFTILYEDYLPIRIAGDMIFNTLDARVQSAAADLQAFKNRTGIRDETIEAARRVFEAVDGDGNGVLTPEEIKDSRVLEVFPSLAPEVSVESFMRAFDTDGNGTIEFQEFLSGSRHLMATGSRQEDESFDALVGQILAEQQERFSAKTGRSDYTRRFNAMVEQFSVWETSMRDRASSSGDDSNSRKNKKARLDEVLLGCFVGARTPPVLNALRIVYEDYRPLRIAGDLIFRLMKAVVHV